jgi:hypothetical protein
MVFLHVTYLLEVSELSDLHPIQPHLPPKTPGAQHRALPVVLLQAHAHKHILKVASKKELGQTELG